MEEGLTMDEETETQVMKDVIKESLQRMLVTKINSMHRTEEKVTAAQPMLLAHPSGYTREANNELNLLSQEQITTFMTDGLVIWDTFLGFEFVEALWSEIEMLDFDGRFEEVIQQKLKGMRTDKLLWVNKTKLEAALGGNHETPMHLSLSYCKNLDKLMDLLFSLPFEINKKTSMGL
jgi:hypothetical protein